MNQFKLTLSILIVLFLTACNISLFNSNKSYDEFNIQLEKTHILEAKQMPKRYIIEPFPDLDIEAKAAILIHGTTGEVLFKKNINQPLAIASMSKVMTELLVLEAIEQGHLNWDDILPISDYAYTISNYPGYASVQLRQDQSYTVKELFYAMAIRSANGATIALAEAVAGSEQEFVRFMNEKAVQLNLKESYFVNSTGLTNIDLLDFHSLGELADSNMMSAENLAMLTRHIVSNYPELLEITKQHEFTFQDNDFINSNWMLPGLQQDWLEEDITFQGVDGLKTGFTSDAGYGFIGTLHADNRRFISVVIGTPDIGDRFTETKTLYDILLTRLNN